MGDAMSLKSLEGALPTIHVDMTLNDTEEQAVTPWFSFTTALPERPLPELEQRPHMTTKRLLIRPITLDDLDDLHALRKIAEIQRHSKTRGRADETVEETKASIEELIAHQWDQWYFGAFLLSTGEMIGEGGLPSCTIMASSNSGWPEAEFLVKPQYWRQGYGTEMFNAIMDSWWDLPREWRRLQVMPKLVQGLDAGSDLPESIVFQWESGNEVARMFFAKVASQLPAAAEGAIESRDTRPGREGNVVRWTGTLCVSPRGPPPKDESDYEEDFSEEEGDEEEGDADS